MPELTNSSRPVSTTYAPEKGKGVSVGESKRTWSQITSTFTEMEDFAAVKSGGLTKGKVSGNVKAPYPDEVLQTPFRSPKERKKHKKSIAAHTCEISYPRLDSILWVVCLYWQACIVQYPRGLVASSGQGSVTGLPFSFKSLS